MIRGCSGNNAANADTDLLGVVTKFGSPSGADFACNVLRKSPIASSAIICRASPPHTTPGRSRNCRE
jgi:hypothetical protein